MSDVPDEADDMLTVDIAYYLNTSIASFSCRYPRIDKKVGSQQ